MMPRIRRGAMVLALFAGATTTFTLLEVSSASAFGVPFSIANGGTTGTVFVDALYGANSCGGTSPDGSGYDGAWDWNASGVLTTRAPWTQSPTNVPTTNPPCGSAQPYILRVEAYPKLNMYDPWTGNIGGAHAQRSRTVDGAGFATFGQIPLPTIGLLDAFRITGEIVSATPRSDNQVNIDLFQVPCGYPDTCPPMKATSTGALVVGAFTTGKNHAMTWTGSVGWPGHYIVYIEDTVTNRKVQGFMEIANGAVPAIDLDAPCFGLTTCIYETVNPWTGGARNTSLATPVGGFHPMAPVRILDTRPAFALGISNGPMKPGDGRESDPNPVNRRIQTANHELKVTGLAGIPTSGVSAVLLNITAATAPSTGWMSVFPRPPATGNNIYYDQATYGAYPTTSNLNLFPGETAPNLVLARVGAGGTIRFWLAAGANMHVIADVAGWFDTGSPTTSPGGLRFTGITPDRLLDTRKGIGDTIGRYHAGDDRSLQVTNIPGVPANAESVVVNITSIAPGDTGYVTAYPNGTARPNASNLNVTDGITRSNLAVVKVQNNKINLAVFETDMDLVVDIFGYYSSSGGGLTTPINPVRVVDTRYGLGTPIGAFGPGETRSVVVTGPCAAGGVTSPTAVILNVTSAETTSSGWLTVWPADVSKPDASNINWEAGRNVPNMAIVKVKRSNGTVSIYNDRGASSVLVDVLGCIA